MRKISFKCIFCGLLAAALLLEGCQEAAYEQYLLTPNETLIEGSVSDGQIYDPAHNTAHQLTADEIQDMNGGKAQMVFNDEGYLTFLYGKYYDGKVKDHEDAIKSLEGVATLIGIAAGSEFFVVYGGQDKNGYTYYTYKQRYGDATVAYAGMHIIIDPEGTPVGLSCSFEANIGIAEEKDPITMEQAQEVVRNRFSTVENLTFYPEAAQKTVVTYIDDNVYNAYAIYTNNFVATDPNFDIAYAEHYVTYDGTYLYGLPTSVLQMGTDDTDASLKYFEGLEKRTWTGVLKPAVGSSFTVTLPVAYNPQSDTYLLMDLDRKIAVGSYYDFAMRGIPIFESTADNTGWDNNHMLTYLSYIRSYDFYAEEGYYSVDGFGTPIFIGTGLCDERGNAIDNACYCGIMQGWAFFAASDVNTYSEAADVTTHEFTHGVTGYSRTGDLYQNETGAINEAYSDIMGNICEMMKGYTYDEDKWLLGEMGNATMRSMSSPHDYRQPTSISDPYYQPPTDTSDNGGVHTNNSLLSHIAYKLWKQGMSFEDSRSLWLTSSEMLTPLSGYKDVHAALLMSVDINGLSESYQQMITDAFNEAGLLN